jgi:hypothetical protein
MTSKKSYSIRSEGDMENVMEKFFELSKTKTKKKTMSIVVPTAGLSNIVITNLNSMFLNRDMGNPRDYHVHIFLEEE